MMLAAVVLVSLFIAAILYVLISLLALKAPVDSEKLSPFECGFSPKLNSRMNFSLQFFLVTLIFLIFDVELILMFPFLPHLTNGHGLLGLMSLILFIVALSGGLFWEWGQGMLEWRK